MKLQQLTTLQKKLIQKLKEDFLENLRVQRVVQVPMKKPVKRPRILILREAVQVLKIEMLWSQMVQTLILWFLDQKIFGLLSSMPLGVVTVKNSNLNGMKQQPNLKDKSNLVKLMQLLKQHQHKDLGFLVIPQLRFSNMEKVNQIQRLLITQVEENLQLSQHMQTKCWINLIYSLKFMN